MLLFSFNEKILKSGKPRGTAETNARMKAPELGFHISFRLTRGGNFSELGGTRVRYPSGRRELFGTRVRYPSGRRELFGTSYRELFN